MKDVHHHQVWPFSRAFKVLGCGYEYFTLTFINKSGDIYISAKLYIHLFTATIIAYKYKMGLNSPATYTYLQYYIIIISESNQHWPGIGSVLPCTLLTRTSVLTPAVLLKQPAVRRHSEHSHGVRQVLDWPTTHQANNISRAEVGFIFMQNENVALRWSRLTIAWTSPSNFTSTWGVSP